MCSKIGTTHTYMYSYENLNPLVLFGAFEMAESFTFHIYFWIFFYLFVGKSRQKYFQESMDIFLLDF